MLLFYRLILAFLIADYPLQTSGIFRLRYEKRWGVFVHAGIHLVVTLLLCLPWLGNLWFVGGVIVVQLAHGFFDMIEKKTLWAFIGDQLFHIATLIGLTLIFADMPIAGWLPAWLERLWADNYLINLLSGVLMSTYSTAIFVWFANKTLRKGFQRKLFTEYYRYSFMFSGLAVFVGTVLAVQLNPLFLLPGLLPMAFFIYKARKSNEDDGSYSGAFRLDYLWATVAGVVWGVIIGLKLYL
ncbi:DUF3307 domain-containing protein [bacterium]|nr:DUF3307 domain-containing protein [bacterium]